MSLLLAKENAARRTPLEAVLREGRELFGGGRYSDAIQRFQALEIAALAAGQPDLAARAAGPPCLCPDPDPRRCVRRARRVDLANSVGVLVGIQTPGVVTASFVLSWYDPATRNYTSYATRTATAAAPAPPDRIGKTAVQATGLSGTVVDVELGHFKFNSSTVLPAGFDQTKTHTIAVYGRRTMPADIMDGKVYIDNAELDFRPDGQPGRTMLGPFRSFYSSGKTVCEDFATARGARTGERLEHYVVATLRVRRPIP